MGRERPTGGASRAEPGPAGPSRRPSNLPGPTGQVPRQEDGFSSLHHLLPRRWHTEVGLPGAEVGPGRLHRQVTIISKR